MGVEQWLYDRLGRPPLSIVGEVASGLDHPVDWITEDDELPDPARPARPGPAGRVGAAPDDQRILMVGGCDLNTTAQFLGGRIRTEFAHTGPTGSFIHVGHTETLRQSAAGLTDGQRAVVDRIPFLDQSVYRSSVVVSPDYDVLVYSVLTDYTQGLYRHRDTNLIVPWLQFDFDITDPDRWGPVETRLGREGINREFLRWFTDEFEFRVGYRRPIRGEHPLVGHAGSRGFEDRVRERRRGGAVQPQRTGSPPSPHDDERHSRPSRRRTAERLGLRCAHLRHQPG